MWINDDMYDYLLTLMAATPVNLGTADNFAVLAGTEVTDVPTSAIRRCWVEFSHR